uniref:Uncharacterized protein n=1 Tax=Anguilla anguilla TaxID=7936 RepID=A0A0E9V8B8_ANGAN
MQSEMAIQTLMLGDLLL